MESTTIISLRKATAVIKLVKVWNDVGRNPKYHQQQKDLLLKNWPSLYKALEELVK